MSLSPAEVIGLVTEELNKLKPHTMFILPCLMRLKSENAVDLCRGQRLSVVTEVLYLRLLLYCGLTLAPCQQLSGADQAIRFYSVKGKRLTWTSIFYAIIVQSTLHYASNVFRQSISQGNFELLNRVSKSIVRASIGLSSSASITSL